MPANPKKDPGKFKKPPKKTTESKRDYDNRVKKAEHAHDVQVSAWRRKQGEPDARFGPRNEAQRRGDEQGSETRRGSTYKPRKGSFWD